MSNYYTQSTCTPSRASLMTGRYATNTGLVFAMLPGAVSGLPDTMMTLPRLLRDQANFEAHMVGKWHLGHAQWKQTPVGKGFQTHVGSLLWSMDYNSKQIWQEPWSPMVVDWIRAHENGTYSHYLEERHSTQALTEEAIGVITRHADLTQDLKERSLPPKPLFLYLAYTAAHAPLLPSPGDTAFCEHLSHPWRKDFCGLMVGLDRGIGHVLAAAQTQLGDDTVVVFASDNGGAPFFGGLNYPLRGSKTGPFEGGVRVPACVADFSLSGKYFGVQASKKAGNSQQVAGPFLIAVRRCVYAIHICTCVRECVFDICGQVRTQAWCMCPTCCRPWPVPPASLPARLRSWAWTGSISGRRCATAPRYRPAAKYC